MNVFKQLSLLLLFLVFSSELILAQNQSSNIERFISGSIFDKKQNTPLMYSTVSVINSETNKTIQGVLVGEDGNFEIEIDNKFSNYYLLVEFLGYKPKAIKNLDLSRTKIKLERIYLEPDTENLDEVTVVGEVSRTTFKLDKRIFNVGKDLTATGATTLEILENVPSVTTDIKGKISLRGNSNVKILVNGNSSASTSKGSAALNGIAPDMIERVEVITNPSAKYDAAGTAGILNIVLKKEKKSGLNGSLTFETGIPNNHGLGTYVNYRTKKLNINAGIKVRSKTYKSKRESLTRNKKSDPVESFYTNGKGQSNSKNINANIGVDYNLSQSDFISLSGAIGNYKGDETYNYDYLRKMKGYKDQKSSRNELTKSESPNYEYQLNYRKFFGGNEEHNLEVKFNNTSFSEKFKSDYTNQANASNISKQRSSTNFTELKQTYQIDYVYPFSKEGKLELGGKYTKLKLDNNYSVDDYSEDKWISNSRFTNIFEYTENLKAAYAMAEQEFGRFGVKAGLRLENTVFRTLLKNTKEESKQNYTNFFPSLYTSYKFSDAISMQLSYSKRITRPNMHMLNPFESISDNFNQFKGNPSLKPEYTNSFELGTIFDFQKASINASLYRQNTSDKIERTVTVVDGITISKPFNIGKQTSTGVELNSNLQVSNWFRVMGDFNWFHYKRTGIFKQENFNFSSSQWTASLSSKFKLPKKFDTEITFKYRSKRKQLLQTLGANYYMNFGLKKRILNNRVSMNFNIKDVFNSRKSSLIADQIDYYRQQKSYWGGRRFTLGVSIKLGKADVEKTSSFGHGGEYH